MENKTNTSSEGVLKKNLSFTEIVKYSVIIFFFLIFISVITSGPSGNPNTPTTPAPETPKITQQDKKAAQAELDDFMAVAKKATLVDSYEFSDSATTVFVGNVWYTQPVSFKKDFLAKIAMLKEKITGYRHFEVRDAYSNEKVAEVTAFIGSLEVYK